MAGSKTIQTTPATDAALVTASDSVDLAVAGYPFVTVAGNLKVTTHDGTTLVLPSVPVGLLPLCVSRVWATSTTATVGFVLLND